MSLNELNASRVINVFKTHGAFIENGHFEYTSGRHGSAYVDPDPALSDPEVPYEFGMYLADRIKSLNLNPHTIVGPETGGAYLALWTAWHLSSSHIRTIFWVGLKKRLWSKKRKFYAPVALLPHIQGKDIIVVDDVATRGTTLNSVLEFCRKQGGRVLYCGCVWNRGEVVAEEIGGTPIFSIVEKRLEDWDQNSLNGCPICRVGKIPLDTVYGHGASHSSNKK